MTQPAAKRLVTEGALSDSTSVPRGTLAKLFLGIFTPEQYGATGNGVADDTTYIQAAITAAARTPGGRVMLKGTYKITDEVTVPAGVVIEGVGMARYVTITQATNTKHGLRVLRDTGGGESFNRGPIIRNIRIIGPGATNSVGKAGVYCVDDADTINYQGQRLDLDVIVSGFETGVKTYRWDNSKITLQVESCKDGLVMAGNANSNVIDLSATTLTGTAFILGDGGGNHVNLRDVRATAMVMQIGASGNAQVFAGNFEEITGATAYFEVLANGQLELHGGSYTKGTLGTDIPCVRVRAGGGGAGYGLYKRGGFTVPEILVDQTASFPWHGGQIGAGALGISQTNGIDGTYNVPMGALVRQDGSIPSASAALRGTELAEMGRDANNVEDRKWWYGRDRLAGTDRFIKRLLTSVLAGNGTPEAQTGMESRRGNTYQDGSGATGIAPLWVKNSGAGNTGWVPVQLVTTATTAQLASVSQAVNTTSKFVGREVFNTDTLKCVWATGTATTSTWVDATGTVAHTPV